MMIVSRVVLIVLLLVQLMRLLQVGVHFSDGRRTFELRVIVTLRAVSLVSVLKRHFCFV